MSAVLGPLVKPETACCSRCSYPLQGLKTRHGRGRCPECGTRFDLSPRPAPRPRPEVGFWRGLDNLRERFSPTFRTIAILLLLLGAASLVISFGWIAYARLEQKLFAW